MQISHYPQSIFWSYAPNADLPDELVAEQVILYGDLDDIFRISKELPQELIQKVTDKIAERGHWEKRVNFMNKIILNK